jgi:hypothetical protein
MAPLCLAFAWSSDFLWHTHLVAAGVAEPNPWHPFLWAAPAFIIAMVWLFVTIVVWALYLTRDR